MHTPICNILQNVSITTGISLISFRSQKNPAPSRGDGYSVISTFPESSLPPLKVTSISLSTSFSNRNYFSPLLYISQNLEQNKCPISLNGPTNYLVSQVNKIELILDSSHFLSISHLICHPLHCNNIGPHHHFISHLDLFNNIL